MIKARDNPFRSHCVEQLAFRPQGMSWEQLLTRLQTLGTRAAVVGAEGVGKTTLLEQLRDRLTSSQQAVRYWRISGSDPPPAMYDLARWADAPGCVLIFDGADHLPWWSWQMLKHRSKRAAGLVISSHRKGMLPTLIENRTSAALLSELVTDLVGQRAATRLAPLLLTILEKHQGNIRLALMELYDHWATLPPAAGG